MGRGREIFGRDALKGIAAVTMLIDHFACVFVDAGTYRELYLWMRRIGRLSFPLFCFVLVQGIMTTRDARKYLRRLFVFAVLSEIPYDLAFSGTLFDPGRQNVIATLFLGALLLVWMERCGSAALAACLLCGCFAAAEWLHTDYGAMGVALIVVFYFLRFRPFLQMFWAAVLLAAGFSIEAWAVFALPLCFCYAPEQRGRRLPRYFFYLFYPCHLLAFGLAGLVLR